MTSFLAFIFRYRLHVAALAGLLTAAPFAIDGTGAGSPESVLASVAVTLVMAAIYLSNKATDLAEDAINTGGLPIDAANARTVTIIAATCFALPMLWLWIYPAALAAYLFFGGFLGYMYNYGVPVSGKRLRFKDILFFKNISSSFIWSGCTSMLYAAMAPEMQPFVFVSHFVSVFALVTCIEIVWDIRDLEGDRANGIRTIANTFGVNAAKLACLAILLPYLAWIYSNGLPSLVLGAAHTATLAFIVFATPSRPAFYFQWIVVLWALMTMLGIAQG